MLLITSFVTYNKLILPYFCDNTPGNARLINGGFINVITVINVQYFPNNLL